MCISLIKQQWFFSDCVDAQADHNIAVHICYSKTCLKRLLKNRQNKGLNGKW